MPETSTVSSSSSSTWYVTQVAGGPTGADRIQWPGRPLEQAALPDAFATYRAFYDFDAGV